ncbi:MAG: hypothetical protein FJZ89_01305 [Chloroflexi bacterium]|nr:hypothetical protein [Chloroflexota bacterium]
MPDHAAVKLPTTDWERIVRLGTERHLEELEAELQVARQHIAAFERKYGLTFARLQQVGLPDDAGLEAHEDYVAWSSWEGRAAELKSKLEELQAIVEYDYAS